MLFVHFKQVKMGIDLLSYITTIQLPFKPPEYPEYSNIRIPIRIFEYQFWYSLPSLILSDTQCLFLDVARIVEI